jgi:hypothetical protein
MAGQTESASSVRDHQLVRLGIEAVAGNAGDPSLSHDYCRWQLLRSPVPAIIDRVQNLDRVKTRQPFAQHLVPRFVKGRTLARRTFGAVVAAEAISGDRRNLDEFTIDSIEKPSVDFSEWLVPHLSRLRVKPTPETQ